MLNVLDQSTLLFYEPVLGETVLFSAIALFKVFDKDFNVVFQSLVFQR